MSDIVDTEVTIVGAGISGLATAHYLTSRGIHVQILEKNDRTGGTIETRRRDGFLIDCGPNSALDTTPLLSSLFGDLDIAGSREFARPEAKNRYIVRRGRLCALPMNPPALVRTPLFSRSTKWRLLKEPFIPPSDPDAEETVAEFVKRRLGTEMLDYAINPFVSGVFAGAPEELSVRAGFPKLFEIEQRYGSLIKGAIKGRRERNKRAKAGEITKQSARLFSFTNGMQTLVDSLADEQGEAVHKKCHVDAIRKTPAGFEVDAGVAGVDRTFLSSALVLAVPAYAYAELNIEFAFPVLERLTAIPYPPVSMVFFGYRSTPTDVPLDGFGFLVPAKERRNVLGTIWSSTLFSGRAPEGGAGLTTFVGGTRQPANALLPDEELVDVVKRDLADLLHIRSLPDVTVIRRWQRAIPQYNVGHLEIVRGIEDLEKSVQGLFLTGNFRGGISVGDCVKQSHSLATRVSTFVQSPPK